MEREQILVARTNALLVTDLELALTPFARFKGLMMRERIAPGAGLWLSPCASIHMAFMRFAIDVVWLDSQTRVLKVSAGVRPWIGFASCWGARTALELPAGAAAGVEVGDQLLRRSEVDAEA